MPSMEFKIIRSLELTVNNYLKYAERSPLNANSNLTMLSLLFGLAANKVFRNVKIVNPNQFLGVLKSP